VAEDSLLLTAITEDGFVHQRNLMNVLRPNRRITLDMESEFPDLAGRRFGVVVESAGDSGTKMPLVVERAMYADANGVLWAAGSNVVATRIQ
jgi:hypothetical protein